MDLEAALNRLGRDRRLLADMIQFYLEDAPTLLEDARRGLDANDAVTFERAAHSLKGLSSNFSAERAIDAARELEILAGTGDLSQAHAGFERLEREVTALREALESYQRTAR
jgi:HPt (histidine-containing phosphotransfer) domain-containing protein